MQTHITAAIKSTADSWSENHRLHRTTALGAPIIMRKIFRTFNRVVDRAMRREAASQQPAKLTSSQPAAANAKIATTLRRDSDGSALTARY